MASRWLCEPCTGTKVQGYGCYALGNLANDTPENWQRNPINNGIDVILRAMQQHEQHTKVQGEGFYALGQLARNNRRNKLRLENGNAEIFVMLPASHYQGDNPGNRRRFADGIFAVIGAMQQHRHHAEVQLCGWNALGQFAKGKLEGPARIAIIGQILQDMRQDEPKIQRGNLKIPFEMPFTVLLGLRIAQAMEEHEQCTELQEWGCYISVQLAHAIPKKYQHLLGFSRVILKAMKEHQHHVNVQRRGCYALRYFARSGIADYDGIDVILRAMQQHKQNTEVQRYGCYALAHLAADNPENIRRIANHNDSDVIVYAMPLHKHHTTVQAEGCFVLEKLASNSLENQQRIANATEIDLTLLAMQLHEKDAAVQSAGCFVFGKLASKSPENQQRIAKANGIVITVLAMQLHKQDAAVQIAGCIALGKLASENPENQQKIAKANGIGVIVLAMQLHKQNTDWPKLASDYPENHQRTAKAIRIDIIRGLQQYERHEEVQRWGSYALAEILAASR